MVSAVEFSVYAWPSRVVVAVGWLWVGCGLLVGCLYDGCKRRPRKTQAVKVVKLTKNFEKSKALLQH